MAKQTKKTEIDANEAAASAIILPETPVVETPVVETPVEVKPKGNNKGNTGGSAQGTSDKSNRSYQG